MLFGGKALAHAQTSYFERRVLGANVTTGLVLGSLDGIGWSRGIHWHDIEIRTDVGAGNQSPRAMVTGFVLFLFVFSEV